MGWLRRTPPAVDEDPQRPLEPYERVYPREYRPEPKPADLVEAAERSIEWTRAQPALQPMPEPDADWQPPSSEPDSEQHPTVPFTRALPAGPGVYWHVPSADPGVLHQLVVIRCGAHLCVMQRRIGSDSVAYVNVNRIGGWFAGPIASPEGVALEDIRL